MKKFLIALMGLFLFANLAIAADSPESEEGATTVDTAKAKELHAQGVRFLDPRKSKDFKAGRIPGAVHLELKKKLKKDALAAQIKPSEAVVVYCNGLKCLRSSQAINKMIPWGYKTMYYYRDGLPKWVEAGHPVEK